MATSNLESYFLRLVNQSRSEAGLAPLVFDAELEVAAQNHTVWMDQTDTLSHTGMGGSSPGDRIAAAGYDAIRWAENIAYISRSGPTMVMDQAAVDQLHQELMNSPSHRANILSVDVKEVGIGLHQGDFGGLSTVFATEVFGSPTPAEALETDKGYMLP